MTIFSLTFEFEATELEAGATGGELEGFKAVISTEFLFFAEGSLSGASFAPS